MKQRLGHSILLASRKALWLVFVTGAHFAGLSPAWAALQSGIYQTPPDTTAFEAGDRVPNKSRVVPFFATLKFDLQGNPPSLIAVITNAVLEGGSPFELTVHSSSESQLPDGTYRFQGDYLRDLNPSGTQYLFDWRFSSSTNGGIVFNGMAYWAGGHIWYEAISNITLVPLPSLTISRASAELVRITWATNFTDYVLESATDLRALDWTTVTNTVPASVGERVSVTRDVEGAQRFYRLRKPQGL